MQRLDIGSDFFNRYEPTPRKEILEKLRTSVAGNEAGLIHGQWKDDNGGLCAMACLEATVAREFEKGGPKHLVIGDETLPTQVAEVNDSVPDATPIERKAKVLAWIDEQLATEQAKAAA